MQITITAQQAMELSQELHTRSVWLRELIRISNLDNAARRTRDLKDFVAVYSYDTSITIKILFAQEAAARGLGYGNWVTFAQAERTIYLHGGVFQLRTAVKEIGHEVGAAELYRVYGINKEAIPLVSNRLPGATGSYLTHYLDMLIRTPD